MDKSLYRFLKNVNSSSDDISTGNFYFDVPYFMRITRLKWMYVSKDQCGTFPLKPL